MLGQIYGYFKKPGRCSDAIQSDRWSPQTVDVEFIRQRLARLVKDLMIGSTRIWLPCQPVSPLFLHCRAASITSVCGLLVGFCKASSVGWGVFEVSDCQRADWTHFWIPLLIGEFFLAINAVRPGDLSFGSFVALGIFGLWRVDFDAVEPDYQ